MRSAFISPHDDDQILFGAFSLLGEIAKGNRPIVIVVYDSHRQWDSGLRITSSQRARESQNACRELGDVPVVRLGFADNLATSAAMIRERAVKVMRNIEEIDRLFVPAYERNGHEHHNLVADAFGHPFPNVIARYMTYKRIPCEKSVSGCEVPIENPEWVAAKLRALSCFVSQFQAQTGCVEHFIGRSLREYYAD